MKFKYHIASYAFALLSVMLALVTVNLINYAKISQTGDDSIFASRLQWYCTIM